MEGTADAYDQKQKRTVTFEEVKGVQYGLNTGCLGDGVRGGAGKVRSAP